MTVDQLLGKATARHTLIVHGSQVFINSHDLREVESYQDLGCTLRPFYSPTYPSAHSLRQGWEVHLVGGCDKLYEPDEDGNEVDVTQTTLLEKALLHVHAGRDQVG